MTDQTTDAECSNCGCRCFGVKVNSEEEIKLECRDCETVGGYGWETSTLNLKLISEPSEVESTGKTSTGEDRDV